MFAVVEPGVISNDLQIELSRRGLFFPPDPSSTVDSTLGGNVAENAGYTRAVKYGVTRDYVRGLEAVLPSGDVIALGGKTKNVAGYDLISLLVGSVRRDHYEDNTSAPHETLGAPHRRGIPQRPAGAADLIVAVSLRDSSCAIELMDNIAINTVADHLGAPCRQCRGAGTIETDGHGKEAEVEALEI